MQKLKLLGNHIGNFRDVSGRVIDSLKNADKIIYEHKITFDELIKNLQISVTSDLVASSDISTAEEKAVIAEELRDGKDVVFISDAGYPLIADPGHGLISFLIDNELEVDIVAGPSISSTALVAAGLKESFGNFVFQEFFGLDIDGVAKMTKIIEPLPQTLVIVDFPNRFPESIDVLIEILGDRKAAFCIELTMPSCKIIRGTLRDAKQYMQSEEYDDTKMSTLVITGKNPTNYA